MGVILRDAIQQECIDSKDTNINFQFQINAVLLNFLSSKES